jgi:probable DNA metabolism protein
VQNVKIESDFISWRAQSRALLIAGIAPEEARWTEASSQDALPGLFSETEFVSTNRKFAKDPIRVPPEFLEQAKYVFAFRAEDTAALLYRIVWRMNHGEPKLMEISIDDDVAVFLSRYRLVRRDVHKMKAFVRFRELDDEFIAWHRPDHRILRLAVPFFTERFSNMKWSILTEDECAHWDTKNVSFTEGVPRSAGPQFDASEDLWKTYYRSTFNPARIKWNAMTKEMPIRHWKTLPETEVIAELMREAPGRLQNFQKQIIPSAEDYLPPKDQRDWKSLQRAIPNCQACGICERASGPVFGEGKLDAEIVLVGEQPGDQEDQVGRPFVGPAGQLLNQALEEAKLKRDLMYLTNAVKGFKFTDQEGRARIHRGSSPAEIAACNPWLKNELSIIRPKKIIALGRSAAQALLGKSVLMRDVRGQVFETSACKKTLIVPHPSSILRIQDAGLKQSEFRRFVDELKLIHTA